LTSEHFDMEEVAPERTLNEGLYQFYPFSISTRHLQEIALRWPVTVEEEPNRYLFTLLKTYLLGLEAFGYGPVPKIDDISSIGRFAFDVLAHVSQPKNCGFFTESGEK
jgi:hypothetical protein